MSRFPLLVGLVSLWIPCTALAQGATSLAAGTTVDLFARDTFQLDAVVCPFKGEIEYEAGDIECALLEVPENREKPDSRFIELLVVKLTSKPDDDDRPEPSSDAGDLPQPAPGRRDDPVVYLTGGPGARVGYYVKRLKEHGILEHRDLYILEQRGIGSSDDFCPEYQRRKPKAANVATFAERLEADLARARDCAENATAAGVDLSGYHTFENARDLRALRLALGLERWNVWGISYGSILGQAYLKVDPEGIRAIVLDAIVPLDVRHNPWAWQTVSWYVRDLEKLDELCREDPGCGRRYPDLADRIRDAAAAVRDNPIAVAVKDTERYPTGTAHLFSDVAAFLPFTLLYEQSEYPTLPGLIHAWTAAVERRDEAVFKLIALAGSEFFDSSQGMANAILCLDGDAEAQVIAARADLETHPVLAAAIGSEHSYQRFAELCGEHAMAPRDAAEFAPVVSDVPALLLAGDMDPITPPPLAEAIVPGFHNGTFAVFPFAGHGPSRSVECAGDMLNLFFDDPAATPDLSCVETMAAPRFRAPLYRTNFAAQIGVRALEDRKTLIAPAAWVGISLVASLVALLVLTFAPLGRRLDRRPAIPTRGARPMAWLAALLATLAGAVLGAAVAATFKASKVTLLVALLPWARYGAIAGLLAGLAGLTAVVLTIRAQRRQRLPITTLLGLVLTGLAAASLSAFLIVWGLRPLG